MINIVKLALMASVMVLASCTNTGHDNINTDCSETAKLDSSDIFNDKVLYGSWFTPHEASIINITFNRDNTFEMNDYKQMGNIFVHLTREGSYSVNGETIKLKCNDGEERIFECIEIEGRIYLCNNNTMMIKGLLN
ncbi:MAG: hypothetical protein MJZ27_05950 [Bacteroidales bacterium]|nr:hypothetical protein [Bacteroidales bacterium]